MPLSKSLRPTAPMKHPDDEWLRTVSREIADGVADLLQQRYKLVDGSWWLFSLGKPQRALTFDKVEYARGRGRIPRNDDA